MSRLEVKRLDSPLARSTGRPSGAAEDVRPPEQQQRATPTPRPKRQPDQDRSKAKLASVPESQPDTQEATPDVLDGLPNPPALTESLELLATATNFFAPITLRARRARCAHETVRGSPRRACPSKRCSPSSSGSLARRRTRRTSPASEPHSMRTAPGATPRPPGRSHHRSQLATHRRRRPIAFRRWGRADYPRRLGSTRSRLRELSAAVSTGLEDRGPGVRVTCGSRRRACAPPSCCCARSTATASALASSATWRQ